MDNASAWKVGDRFEIAPDYRLGELRGRQGEIVDIHPQGYDTRLDGRAGIWVIWNPDHIRPVPATTCTLAA
jgi:hypothetical protein